MSIDYHEPPEELRAETRDEHRALSSLAEELEAIDWYQHRLDVCTDESLREVIKHNRDEEMEHAALTLEWLRRRMPELDARLRKYLFSEGSLVREERDEQHNGHDVGLGIGAMAVEGGAHG